MSVYKSTTTASSGLAIGAEEIAEHCFENSITPASVYKLARPGAGWPVFRLNGRLAARPDAIREEIERREAAAREQARR